MEQCQGIDPNGIPRVYAEHRNIDVAEAMCREEAAAYVRHRPDTGPLSAWSFNFVRVAI